MEDFIYSDASSQNQKVFSVSGLNREVRALLSNRFPRVWVEGEISNLVAPASGHLYFTLKDDRAQIRCALFRGNRRFLSGRPDNGQLVRVRGEVSLFEARGEFQLIVERLEAAGEGALQRAFEALKQRLAAEGLFDVSHKRPLPRIPYQIGLITSPTGAAVRDILTVLKRRFPGVPVVIYPVAVQGEAAKTEIVAAIEQAQRRRECDLLILARGGGSLEDLWAFNEESVARAIYHCRLPIITGIGHEIDFTIADFVADLRAPTPSAAAEAATPERAEWIEHFHRQEQRLYRGMVNACEQRVRLLDWLEKRLQQRHPGRQLADQAVRLAQLQGRLRRALLARNERLAARFQHCRLRLLRHDPAMKIPDYRFRHQQLLARLSQAMERNLERRRADLAAASQTLEAVSPLATLGRGYAIVRRLDDRRIVRACQDVGPGEKVEARLARGYLLCHVEAVKDE